MLKGNILGLLKSRVNKLENVLNHYEQLIKTKNVCQLFIDLIQNKVDEYEELKEMDYSKEYIINDFVGCVLYEVNNILEVMDKNHKDYSFFKDFRNELDIIKNGF